MNLKVMPGSGVQHRVPQPMLGAELRDALELEAVPVGSAELGQRPPELNISIQSRTTRNGIPVRVGNPATLGSRRSLDVRTGIETLLFGRVTPAGQSSTDPRESYLRQPE
jgi:hypothetical protein